MNEFTHHRTDNELGRFTCGSEPFAEAFSPRSFVKRDHGGNIECLAQESVADLGHARRVFDTAAGLMMARFHPRKCRCSSGIAKVSGIGIERKGGGEGGCAPARNAIQQSLLVFMVGCAI